MTTPERAHPRAELARAKVNLALHVTGRRLDGYHLLDSLVVFPQIGDRLAIEASDTLQCTVEGPFAHDLDGPPESNLVLKAAELFAESAGLSDFKIKLTLSKRLPVASGIGGGSSDAATALRLLQEFTGVCLPDNQLHQLALRLGADVPVCLNAQPRIMRGIGDKLLPAPRLPKGGIVLVNPKVDVSTPEIFNALTQKDNPPMTGLPDSFEALETMVAFLKECRNDLQIPAIDLCPVIGETITALQSDERVLLTRMSGSGATVFGLCDETVSMDVERSLRVAHPEWWIASGAVS
ncbi:4-(cytidine 5'-diphospho)-2-C-methyl-D-erythritol kinase [uncultured Roseibium sp.]|uniref:4-(cytidine 5'-diphospho)-2-C-methyl-D-erythritol kinase n=1 Tax=uncultured Roseibium sp. TaxID=1936171 RepID=UPI0026346782|nr:4-(cytidine 5'-diphospho)-2-C-methyl-D-erythritol kinase [uncultured Roseibium sp.]